MLFCFPTSYFSVGISYICAEVIQPVYPSGWRGTPTKRRVSKRQASKRLVSKRPVSKRQVYKTSGFKTSGFKKSGFKTSIEIKASIRPVFEFDIKQQV